MNETKPQSTAAGTHGFQPSSGTLITGHPAEESGVSEYKSASEELFHNLVNSPNVRVQQIVSKGHVSSPGFWYDQTEDEFVLLMAGAARLEFESGEVLELGPNDWVNIPAHARHRVAWTAPDELTLWLAVFTPASVVNV